MEDEEVRAKRYRQRAEEVRAIAETMTDPETRRALLIVANDYLEMAASMDRVAQTYRALGR